MKTRHKIEEDASGSDLGAFEMPETVLCIDTICNICYAEFLDEEDLKLHITQMHLTEQSRSRYCPFCSFIFASVEEYAAHLCEVHIMTLKCCRYCMRAFSHFPDVTKHEKKHYSSSSKSSFSCSNCSLILKTVSELQLHEYTEHKDVKDGVMLHDCYSLLSSFLNMKAPNFLLSLRRNHVYTCAYCKLSTPEVEYYMQHLQQKNCRSLVCDKCCNVYKNIGGIKKHFICHPECHTIQDVLKKSCPKCNRVFKLEILQQHTKECNAIRCNSCDLVFNTIDERTEHQVKSHPMTFSIKICKYCHREFVGQVAMDKHIDRSHRKDFHLYKYFCVYCDDIFNHPKKLFSHFYREHKDLKPFTCKICDKTFKLRKQFTLHIKLNHKSVGNVKFDDKFHVFFTDEELLPEVIQSGSQSTSNEKNSDHLDSLKTDAINKETAVDHSQSLLIPMKKKTVKLTNNDIDLAMCITETEADQTDIEANKTIVKPAKRKRTRKTKEPIISVDLTNNQSDDFSDDEPLIQVKRRVKAKEIQKLGFSACHMKSKEMMRNRLKFTCKICKKYCYTFQNYNHHMSLHQTHENKKCIKCPKIFKSKTKLIKHIQLEHSTSKLTETLKTVLERRKNSLNNPNDSQNHTEMSRKTVTERFLQTIKRVNTEMNSSSAVVTPVVNKLSVRKFIENFTPESNETNKKDQQINICNSVTIKPIKAPINKSPVIKLTKFKQEVQPRFVKLKPPERFKESINEPYNVSIRLIQRPIAEPKMNFDLSVKEESKPCIVEDKETEILDNYEDADDTGETIIPEVAQEVMLEAVETPKPKNYMHKIVIPNLPKQYKDVHIAHLLPEAPYYKIVKIDEVLMEQKKEPEKQSENLKIKLPDGTKLVNVNPLAHLLGDKQLEMQRNKYYKPKLVNFEKAVAKALLISKTEMGAKRKSRVKGKPEQ